MDNGLIVQFGSCEDEELVLEFRRFVEERFRVRTRWGLGKRSTEASPVGWTMLQVDGGGDERASLSPEGMAEGSAKSRVEADEVPAPTSCWQEEPDPVVFVPGEIFLNRPRSSRRHRRQRAREILLWLRQHSLLEPELDISLFPMLDPEYEKPLQWWTGRRVVRRMQDANDRWAPQVWVA